MPHSPLVSKIRCHNPNQNKSRVCNRNYAIYIGTREGVDLSALDHVFDDLDDDKMSQQSSNELYAKYISERPNSNGLFGNIDVSDIGQVGNYLADLTANNRNIYRGIVSLSPQDALELGYDDKQNWDSFIRQTIPDVAKEFKIPIQDLEWCAAVHMEPTHPHCHYMFWSKKDMVSSPFIHTSVQNRCRELLSKEMFKKEREQTILVKNIARDMLVDEAKLLLTDESKKIQTIGRINNNELCSYGNDLIALSSSLPRKGRMDYKLLTPDAKKQVDQFVDKLLSQKDIKKQYLSYMSAVDTISHTYSASPKHSSINSQKASEDIRKRLANIILKSCSELRKQNIFFENNQVENTKNYDDDLVVNQLTPSEQKKIKTCIAAFYNERTIKNLEILKNYALNGSGIAAYVYAKNANFLYHKPLEIPAEEINKFYKIAERDFCVQLKKLTTTTNTSIPTSILYNRLGTIYNHGFYDKQTCTFKPDIPLAISYFEKGMELENHFATYNLGKIYANPEGNTFYDLSRAISLFEQAASQGNQFAPYNLGKIYTNPNEKYYNPSLGISNLEKAYNYGNHHAAAKLGSIYLWGNHAPKDEQLGKEYLLKAKELGNSYADNILQTYEQYKEELLLKQSISLGYRLLKSCFNSVTSKNNQFQAAHSSTVSRNAQIDKLTRAGLHVDPNDKTGL